jgi:putative FmdB family regulatory protein
MPLFEYTCHDCQHTFEELVFGEETVECPECEGRRVERQLGVPARPQQSTNLPLSCNRDAPPCGAPNCCRL